LRPACQNGRLANLVPKQNIFFADFFCLTFKFGLVKYRYKEKEKERKKMYALRFDGFIQSSVYHTVEDAKIAYNSAVKNTLLYEYDCAVVMIDDSRKVIRVLSFEELK
jgi:hypothetical protein